MTGWTYETLPNSTCLLYLLPRRAVNAFYQQLVREAIFLHSYDMSTHSYPLCLPAWNAHLLLQVFSRGRIYTTCYTMQASRISLERTRMGQERTKPLHPYARMPSRPNYSPVSNIAHSPNPSKRWEAIWRKMVFYLLKYNDSPLYVQL